jgi:beta-aspartyl-peptidase (threonine type)
VRGRHFILNRHRLGGKGGLIAVAPDGEAAWGFSTPAMYRGMADATGRTVAIYADDEER